MALTHRDAPFNGDHIGVVDDLVHNSVANRAVLGRIGIDSFVPAVGIVLRAENGGAVFGSRLNDFKQIIGLLQRQGCVLIIKEDLSIKINVLLCMHTRQM